MPLGPYVLDFYCPAANLAVELDGEHHVNRAVQDRTRDEIVARTGVQTLRIPDRDMFNRLEETLELIKRTCDERIRKRE